MRNMERRIESLERDTNVSSGKDLVALILKVANECGLPETRQIRQRNSGNVTLEELVIGSFEAPEEET